MTKSSSNFFDYAARFRIAIRDVLRAWDSCEPQPALNHFGTDAAGFKDSFDIGPSEGDEHPRKHEYENPQLVRAQVIPVPATEAGNSDRDIEDWPP